MLIITPPSGSARVSARVDLAPDAVEDVQHQVQVVAADHEEVLAVVVEEELEADDEEEEDGSGVEAEEEEAFYAALVGDLLHGVPPVLLFGLAALESENEVGGVADGGADDWK